MQTLLRWLLIFLLLFNAAGAFFGGISLLLDPSGGRIQLPLILLDGSPFRDYFLPGVFLILINGILPLTAAAGLILRRPRASLPLFPRQHWSWTLALLAGIGLIVWIAVQIALLGYWKENPIQALYGILGIAIAALTLLPALRRFYRLEKK